MMRRRYVLVLALLVFAATASAQTQVQAPQGRVTIETHVIDVFHGALANSSTSSATIDDVVTRMMSFDRNRDQKVAAAELPERMEGIVARGDVDGDAALDTGEIETLARTPRAATAQGGALHTLGGSVYGFADDGFSGFSSSRSHVEDVISDLRLTTAEQERAMAAAAKILDTLESQRRQALLKEMEPALTPANLLEFTQTLDTLESRRGPFVTKVAVSGEKRVFVAGLDTQKLVARYSMTPEQHARALAAAKRFDDARLNEAEQVALVDAMKGVLPGEDRDDFRAALARRPVVQRGGSTVVFTKTLGKIDNPSLVDALFVER